MKQITVSVTEINSDQEWATNPDMVAVQIKESFLEKAEKCLAFMAENDVSYVCCYFSFFWDFFELQANQSDKEKSVVMGPDGKNYVEFEPDFSVSGCHAKIWKDGTIKAVFPFKHDPASISITIGTLDDLKASFAAIEAEVQVA